VARAIWGDAGASVGRTAHEGRAEHAQGGRTAAEYGIHSASLVLMVEMCNELRSTSVRHL
jgi:hypothetical protein